MVSLLLFWSMMLEELLFEQKKTMVNKFYILFKFRFILWLKLRIFHFSQHFIYKIVIIFTNLTDTMFFPWQQQSHYVIFFKQNVAFLVAICIKQYYHCLHHKRDGTIEWLCVSMNFVYFVITINILLFLLFEPRFETKTRDNEMWLLYYSDTIIYEKVVVGYMVMFC